MAHPDGWEVGMTICAAISRHHAGDVSAYEGVITKVGRKWITFTHTNGFAENRFDPENMQIDGRGYASPGRIYASMDEFEADQEAKKAWAELRKSLQWQQPAGLNAARIRQIIAELNGETNGKAD